MVLNCWLGLKHNREFACETEAILALGHQGGGAAKTDHFT